MSVWKCFVAATAEELCSVFILYTKFFSFCSIYWRFGFWSSVLYAVGWIVLSSVFPQPWYRGPTKIFELNEPAFRDKVQLKKPTTVPVDEIKGPRITELDANEKEAKKPTETKKPEIDSKYWIVMLYANWSVTCLNFEPVLAKLSIEYDLPHLKFGQIDIDVYPNLAEEFGVSKDPASFDLPTLILFQQGKEIRRLPELTMPKEGTKLTKASAAKDAITRLGWNKKSSTVVTAFQLEKIANEKIN
ncbi:thioredoxin-like protein [Helicostylum pulchrum]|nr:thioredoxin-like protein [Helicostylum pulchrum]